MADGVGEHLPKARLRELLRLLARALRKGLLVHLALGERLESLGQMARALDLARALLVAHVLHRGVHGVARLGLLHHRRELELADEVVKLFGSEEHRVERARVDKLVVVQPVQPAQVVPRARVLIRQHLVGLAQLLELFVGLRVVEILVGVHLARLGQVRALDLRARRVGLHAEHIVEARVLHTAAAAAALAALAALAAAARAAAAARRAARGAKGLAARSELLDPLGVRLLHRLQILRQAVGDPLPALLVPLLAPGRAAHRKRRLHGAARDLRGAGDAASDGHGGGGADAFH